MFRLDLQFLQHWLLSLSASGYMFTDVKLKLHLTMKCQIPKPAGSVATKNMVNTRSKIFDSHR